MVWYKTNPSDADSRITGFCILPISVPDSYYCQVFANYFNNSTNKDKDSLAILSQRHGNFIVNSSPWHMNEISGFRYGLDFSPTVTNIGFGYYAMIVCIKRNK